MLMLMLMLMIQRLSSSIFVRKVSKRDHFVQELEGIFIAEVKDGIFFHDVVGGDLIGMFFCSCMLHVDVFASNTNILPAPV